MLLKGTASGLSHPLLLMLLSFSPLPAFSLSFSLLIAIPSLQHLPYCSPLAVSLISSVSLHSSFLLLSIFFYALLSFWPHVPLCSNTSYCPLLSVLTTRLIVVISHVPCYRAAKLATGNTNSAIVAVSAHCAFRAHSAKYRSSTY